MTYKEYYFNPTATACEATVEECIKVEDNYDIRLNKTVIFAASGGQLSDKGKIGSSNVLFAREEGDEVWHLCDAPQPVGAKVNVEYDVEKRLEYSQQHTGEHILSGLAHALFDTQNVGFHMAETYNTLDFDKPLSKEQLRILEDEANKAIQRNIKTQYEFVNDGELTEKEIRKRTEGLMGDSIRIVYCGGVDSCTCCGTHTAYSGEVGAIQITSTQSLRGGVRCFFACGMRAIKDAQFNKDIADALAKRFSTKPENAIEALIKQGDELSFIKRELKTRTDELFKLRAKASLADTEEINGIKVVADVIRGYNAKELKEYAGKLSQNKKTIAVLFSINGENGIYQIERSKDIKLSMREICEVANGITGGRGGGRDDSAQGSVKYKPGAEDAVAIVKDYLKKRIIAEKTI